MPNTLLNRPKLYNETFFLQDQRIKKELVAAQEHHTLKVIREMQRWLENRRLVEQVFDEADLTFLVYGQCRVEGVNSAHLSVATEIIVANYLQRGSDANCA